MRHLRPLDGGKDDRLPKQVVGPRQFFRGWRDEGRHAGVGAGGRGSGGGGEGEGGGGVEGTHGAEGVGGFGHGDLLSTALLREGG